MYLFMYLLRVCGCVCLKMSFHYLEREISLENQVNSWKKKLDLCEGRLNFCLCFFVQLKYIPHIISQGFDVSCLELHVLFAKQTKLKTVGKEDAKGP